MATDHNQPPATKKKNTTRVIAGINSSRDESPIPYCCDKKSIANIQIYAVASGAMSNINIVDDFAFKNLRIIINFFSSRADRRPPNGRRISCKKRESL